MQKQHRLEKVSFKREKRPSKEGKFFIQKDLISKGESKKFENKGYFSEKVILRKK
jgi:hypothetical protein